MREVTERTLRRSRRVPLPLQRLFTCLRRIARFRRLSSSMGRLLSLVRKTEKGYRYYPRIGGCEAYRTIHQCMSRISRYYDQLSGSGSDRLRALQRASPFRKRAAAFDRPHPFSLARSAPRPRATDRTLIETVLIGILVGAYQRQMIANVQRILSANIVI